MKDDEAVSPVVGVILMVAITVVLAAVTYSWVSGFGGNSSGASSASFAQSGVASAGTARFTIASASAFEWNHAALRINNAVSAYSEANSPGWCVLDDTGSCNASLPEELARAGEVLVVRGVGEGDELMITDTEANAAIARLIVR